MSLPTLFPEHDHCRNIGPYAVPPNNPWMPNWLGCSDDLNLVLVDWSSTKAVSYASCTKPNAVDRARTTESPISFLSQMATDKHNSFESNGYGSAHKVLADLCDLPCPALLVLSDWGKPSNAAHAN